MVGTLLIEKFMDNKLQHGIQFLANLGLPLFASLPCDILPPDIMQAFAAEKIDHQPYHSLVLLGNAGPEFWPALTEFGLKTADPVDYFIRPGAQQFIGPRSEDHTSEHQ